MKTTLLRILLLPLLLLGSAVAVDPSGGPTPPRNELHAGLLVSLTASGYKFIIADAAPARLVRVRTAVVEPGVRWKHAFVASAVVANRSRSEIKFTFNDAGGAAVKWGFRVLDADGNEVWRSDADVLSAQVETDATLPPGRSWRRMIEVPLAPGDQPLKPGVYTLEASIAADKPVSATSVFEVVSQPEVMPISGINGKVVKVTTGDATEPVPGAIINISEIRLGNARYSAPPFNWVGRAGDDGAFTVKTPPGHFRVTATEPVVVDPPVSTPGTNTAAGTPRLSKSVEVAVVEGHYTDVTIRLAAPVVETKQGIEGVVLIGPISPVEIEGQPNEAPLAGARVTIAQIRPEVEIAIFPPPPLFHWSGTTNEHGRFGARTPAGKFRVTASKPHTEANAGAIAGLPAPASIVVEVQPGKFSEVALHLDSGIR